MPDGRLRKLLNLTGDVRGPEVRAAVGLAALFFLVTFSFYIVKPVKESFLISVTPAWWPYADLATALLIGFVVALNTRLLHWLPRRQYLTATLLFFIGSLFFFWFVFDVYRKSLALTPVVDATGVVFSVYIQMVILKTWPLAVFLFSFWSDVFIAMSITQFWIAVNDAFNPHEAKRLVGVFVTGGLLGGIVGSLLASLTVLARAITPENLLLVCPVALVLSIVMVNVVYAEQKKLRAGEEVGAPGASQTGYWESFKTVRRDPYLRLLGLVLAFAIIAGALINFQFKIAVKSTYENLADRTSFLAGFFFVILLASALFHLAATSRILKNFSIGTAMLVAPLLLFIGSVSVFIVPAAALMVWAGFVRGGDKLFDSTLSQSVRELMYIPVSAAVKYKAKLFIDMFVNKFATGTGAAMFWVLYRVSGFAYKTTAAQVREVGFLVLAVLGLWIFLTGVLYAEYPSVLKQAIPQLWPRGEKVIDEHVDVATVRQVLDTIQSRERSWQLYLMNLFDLIRQGKLTPQVKELIGLRPHEVRARSLDSVLDVGGETFFPGFEEAIADDSFKNEVDKVFMLPEFQAVMQEKLPGLAGSASEVDRLEAAKLIGMMAPRPEVLAALENLLRDPSPEVVTYALASASAHRSSGLLPAIVRALANPMTRQEAQAALAAYGPAVEPRLAAVLADDGVPPEVRRAVPEVLARLGTQAGADILVGELGRRKDDVEEELIEALYKIRSGRPDIRFNDKKVRAELFFLIRGGYDIFLGGTEAAGGDPVSGPTAEAAAALDLKVKRIFDLMTLLSPPEDIVKAYQNIRQGSLKSVDHSIELLDNLLDRELKGFLFPLIEDLPPDERAGRLKKALKDMDHKPFFARWR